MKTPLTRILLALSIGSALAVSAQAQVFRPNTARDILLGAVAGAVIGHQSGHAAEGAAVGAGVGALVGAAVQSSSHQRVSVPCQSTDRWSSAYINGGSAVVIEDAPTVAYAPVVADRVVYVERPQVVYVPQTRIVYVNPLPRPSVYWGYAPRIVYRAPIHGSRDHHRDSRQHHNNRSRDRR